MMNEDQLIRLMHAVLDGEAGPAEARELDRMLAADPAARAQFEKLRELFAELGSVPKVFAPAGLADAVMERIVGRPQRPGRLRQLLGRSRVSRLESDEARGRKPGNSAWGYRFYRPGQLSGEAKMSQVNSGSNSKRNVWIGTGIAAAAVVLGVYLTLDAGIEMPATGTIAPAQRFRAQQPTAGDVKLGDQAGAPSAQVNPASQTAAGSQAASQAAGQAANQAASQAASQAANQAASQAASQAANQAASQAASQAANQAASQASSQAANQAASQAASQAANQAASQAASQAANQAASQAASQAANQAANQAASQAASQAANQAANQAASQASSHAKK
jgi:hypothetical protein